MPLRRFTCFAILVLLAASGSSTAPAEASVSASASPTSTALPVVYRVNTTDPVVFITIDDGFTRTERAKRMLAGIAHSAFVIRGPLEQDPSFWRRSHERGVSFGNHTARHPNLTRLSRRSQQREICAGRDAVKKVVGTTPVLFRPPGGNWNEDTLRAAHACGMTHLVLWDVVVDGPRISTWGPPIRRGDIILLHYRRDLDVSLKVLMKELGRLGLHPADLQKYLTR